MTAVTIFSLACGVAGWYYLLHASRATHLEALERPADNRLRIRLRRWNGAVMVVIAVGFYTGFRIADNGGSPAWAGVCMGAVLLLMPVVLLLAYVDIRLTRKMRQIQKGPRP